MFFDFEYASEMWDKSLTKNKTDLILNKIGSIVSLNIPTGNGKIFIAILSLCPFLGLWTDYLWHIILLTVGLSIYFVSFSRSRQLCFVLFYEAVLAVFLAPFMSFFATLYIIYVETAVILFFIIRNLSDEHYKRLLNLTVILWVLQCFFERGEGASVLVAFMPYSLGVLSRGKIRRYIFEIIILSLGFYALSKYGGAALLGGGAGVLAMALFRQWHLFIPIILTSPWVVGLGIRVINQGILSENILKTGYFFWSRSFKGISPDYKGIDFGRYGDFAKLIFSVASIVFFWYILRMSRQAVLKIFKKERKSREIMSAGLGAIIGFSIYTFFSKTGSVPSNILIYLWSAALLKRACPTE